MKDLFELLYQCSGVSTDTRTVKKGELFIALKGDNFNGNEYAQQAIDSGANFSVVDEINYADNQKIFYVENGLTFLQKLAAFHRKKFNIPVLGITGSNGKTTTKELVVAVLSKKFNVLYTEGNLNNHIGVPLTLLRLKNIHEIAIVEMGASHVGDIKELTDIAHPTHGIITNIGTAHIEGFGSQENIVKTKTELYQAIQEQKGHIFYNIDDEILKNNLPNDCSYSTYGVNTNGEITGKLENLTPEVNFSWKKEGYQSGIVKTHIIGKYNLYNLLASVCIGNLFEIEINQINEALRNYIPKNNRSQLEITPSNKVVLDAYNANPTSVRVALDSFNEMEGENKFFILGDMLELGENTSTYHQEIIDLTKNMELQGIFIGEIFAGLADKNDILSFKNTQEAKDFLQTASPKGNLILLKGSRGIGLEKLMDIL
ncbi:MAG: UDP-N-acetylmuramoyl-tripeptide--D-alanyl-D-alanine ligase [Brumimicrobium sp.]